MKSLFSKIAQRLYLATALGASLLGFSVTMTPTVAHAHNEMRDNGPDFSGMQFVPGQKWYHLNRDLPASIVADVEEKLGVTLCKIEVSPGQFVSNLMICDKTHPRNLDESIGLLRPMLKTGNGVADWFDGNWAYDMQAGYADFDRAKLINRMARDYNNQPVVRVARAHPATVVAARAETVKVAQARTLSSVRGPEVAEGQSQVWKRDDLKVERRWANGQLVDIVRDGRGMTNQVFLASFRANGTVKWNASDESTRVAALSTHVAPVYAAIDSTGIGSIPMAGVSLTAFNFPNALERPQDRYLTDFYNGVFPVKTQDIAMTGAGTLYGLPFLTAQSDFDKRWGTAFNADTAMFGADWKLRGATGEPRDVPTVIAERKAAPFVIANVVDVDTTAIAAKISNESLSERMTRVAALIGTPASLAAFDDTAVLKPWTPGALKDSFIASRTAAFQRGPKPERDNAAMQDVLAFAKLQMQKNAPRLSA